MTGLKDNGFYNLKPDTELFWQNDSMGINQRWDFFDVIARRVKVVREDIRHMEANSIVLHDGKAIDAEIAICATGWKTRHPHFDDASAARLGLPVDIQKSDPAIQKHWTELTS
jgi:dimethylaniline monooxygenase (N-oxide forming)